MPMIRAAARVAASCAAALLLALAGTAPAAAKFEGRATVVDGDTVGLDGVKQRFRLYGIDTPEKGQTCEDQAGKRYLCGAKAAEYLAELIGRNGRLQCFEEDRDRYGRIVAECATPQNVVVNAAMVRAGWAVEYKQYSDGRYSQEETEAKAAKRGMWAGRFVVPSNWRKGERLPGGGAADAATGRPAAETSASRGGCEIKGNISGSGRIYHMPGQQAYEKTRIDENAGERWFCSEAEAQAAGWRRAKR